MQKKRYFNVRPLAVMLLGVILGILTYKGWLEIKHLKYASAYYIFGVISFAVITVCLFVSFFMKKDSKYFIARVLNKHKVNFIFFLVFMCIGYLVIGIKTNVVINYKSFDDVCYVEGVIEEISEKETYTRIVLKDVLVDNKDKLQDGIVVSVFAEDNASQEFRLGDVVAFKGNITRDNLVDTKINFSTYSGENVYASSVSISGISVLTNRSDLMDDLRQDIMDVLHKNMNGENSMLATGMLLGQKSGMDNDLRDTFSYAGISHILAVSGLHVGFLVAFVMFVLKLCKVKLKYSIIILTALLVFYCALCNYSSSVLRASIMAIVLVAAQLLGERYDALSALSLAGIIILLLFPLDLFNVGFQMSFLCVLSIITLTKPVSDLLRKAKLPKSLADVLAISICVNVVLLPVCANTFSYVSLVGIVSNLIIIPLFSIAYPVLFVTTFLSLIFDFVAFSLVLPETFIHFIKIIADFFAKINFAHFKMFNYGYLIVFFIILLMLMIKFLMANLWIKGSVIGVLSVVVLTLFITSSVSKTYTTYSLHTAQQYSNTASVLTTPDNEKILIGYDKYTTAKLLTDMKVKSVNVFVLPEFSLTYLQDYVEIVREYNVKNVVLPKETYYNDYSLKKLMDVADVHIVDDAHEICGAEFRFLADKDKRYATFVKCENSKLLFVNDLTANQFKKLNKFNLEDMDYIVANQLKNDIEVLDFEVGRSIVSYPSEYNNKEILLVNLSHYELELGGKI